MPARLAPAGHRRDALPAAHQAAPGRAAHPSLPDRTAIRPLPARVRLVPHAPAAADACLSRRRTIPTRANQEQTSMPSRTAERRKQRYAEDPVFREKVLATNSAWSGRNREKINARQRLKYNTDPEHRERMCAVPREPAEECLRPPDGRLRAHAGEAAGRLQNLQVEIRQAALHRSRPSERRHPRPSVQQLQ